MESVCLPIFGAPFSGAFGAVASAIWSCHVTVLSPDSSSIHSVVELSHTGQAHPARVCLYLTWGPVAHRRQAALRGVAGWKARDGCQTSRQRPHLVAGSGSRSLALRWHSKSAVQAARKAVGNALWLSQDHGTRGGSLINMTRVQCIIRFKAQSAMPCIRHLHAQHNSGCGCAL